MSTDERLRHSAGLVQLRDQESLLIAVNLAVLAGLIAIHVVLSLTSQTPVSLALTLFSLRAAMQALEWLWVRSSHAVSHPTTLPRYSVYAVWAHVAFACVASLLSGVPHSHYIVLMVVPTIAAAFRGSWATLAGVIVVAVAVGFVYAGLVQTLDSAGERRDELFEAATDTLTYLAVALVVRALARSLRTEQGQLRASVAALHETRDLLVHEEKLGAVGRFAAGIAHEIRNPVGMMSAAVAMARRSDCPPEQREEMYAVVARESDRLARLTADFLAFARQSQPQRQPTCVRTTLEYVAALARPRAASAGQEIRVSCPAELSVPLDAAQVHQALLNLVGNALDAAPTGTAIDLRAERRSAGDVALCVSQPGAPLAPEIQERLFEPFFTTKTGGTGLGLAISRKIARDHGGDLVLSKNGPDRVQFTLLIPGAESAPAARVPTWPAF